MKRHTGNLGAKSDQTICAHENYNDWLGNNINSTLTPHGLRLLNVGEVTCWKDRSTHTPAPEEEALRVGV